MLKALEDRIAHLALDADVDTLVKLCEAAAKLTWGPQGGRKNDSTRTMTVTRYSGGYTQRQEHINVPPERPRAGFSTEPVTPDPGVYQS